jgi:hypothetical protein
MQTGSHTHVPAPSAPPVLQGHMGNLGPALCPRPDPRDHVSWPGPCQGLCLLHRTVYIPGQCLQGGGHTSTYSRYAMHQQPKQYCVLLQYCMHTAITHVKSECSHFSPLWSVPSWLLMNVRAAALALCRHPQLGGRPARLARGALQQSQLGGNLGRHVVIHR